MNAQLQRILPYLKTTDNVIYETKDEYNITFDGHHVIGFQIDEDDPSLVDILYPAGRDDVASAALHEGSFKFLQLWEAKEF